MEETWQFDNNHPIKDNVKKKAFLSDVEHSRKRGTHAHVYVVDAEQTTHHTICPSHRGFKIKYNQTRKPLG